MLFDGEKHVSRSEEPKHKEDMIDGLFNSIYFSLEFDESN